MTSQENENYFSMFLFYLAASQYGSYIKITLSHSSGYNLMWILTEMTVKCRFNAPKLWLSDFVFDV